MTVGELAKRLEFLREQRAVFKRLVGSNEEECSTLLSFLREQGVEGLSKKHEYDCKRNHEHEASKCCASICWCQRDLQGPTRVGK